MIPSLSFRKLNINNRWNLSMYMGYIGIGDFHPGLSLSVRATRYFGTNPSLDRWFAYCDAGSGISVKSQPQEILTAKGGGGYRVSLSKFTKLDLIASFRFVYTLPDIYVGQQRIEKQFIGRNEGCIASLSVGLGLTF